MSQIEEDAIQVGSKLISDEACTLNSTDQKNLVLLFCLITTRLEFSDDEMVTIPPADRVGLMTREIGPSWKMWIARYGGDDPDSHWCRHFGLRVVSTPTDVINSNECNTQVTTMVLGRLCIQTFSSSVMKNRPGGYRDTMPVRRIWPPTEQEIVWHDLPPLNDAEIISFAEAIPAVMPAIPAGS